MTIVYKRCCGVGVHKKSIVACVVNERGKKEIRSFGTMTHELLDFCQWLQLHQVEMVAMESTASYWKPLFNLLEVQEIPAMLVNAQHIKAVPGRKTDVKDAEWIADLLRHGLLRASFVPKRSDRELKELVRYRISIVEERAREFNRLDKVLQGANIKLSSVASKIDTQSGMDMIRALACGEFDEHLLANMARGSMREKIDDLVFALKGFIQPHQQLMLKSMLRHIDSLSDQISLLNEEIDKRMADKQPIIDALDTIHGVGQQSAQVILAEMGSDMSVFPSAKHLVSWAGLSPSKNESAGKKKEDQQPKEILP